jgi:hypothetical protein
VRITTVDGAVLEEHVLRPRGGPAAPLSADEVRAKFRSNAELALAPETSERLLETIATLPDVLIADVVAPLRTLRDDLRSASDVEIQLADPGGHLVADGRDRVVAVS